MPRGVCQKIKAIRKDFFWGNTKQKGDPPTRKMCLLAWENVCSDKIYEGLGRIPFMHKNTALMCKWFDKWQAEKQKGWNVWLRSKYVCSKSTLLVELVQNLRGSKASRFLLDILQ